MKQLINNYTKLGINKDKILITKSPSVCMWSLTKKCIVGENEYEDDVLELLDDGNGGQMLSYKMIRTVCTQMYSEIPPHEVIKINNSNGIIISGALYGHPYYRYAYIPTT